MAFWKLSGFSSQTLKAFDQNVHNTIQSNIYVYTCLLKFISLCYLGILWTKLHGYIDGRIISKTWTNEHSILASQIVFEKDEKDQFFQSLKNVFYSKSLSKVQ